MSRSAFSVARRSPIFLRPRCRVHRALMFSITSAPTATASEPRLVTRISRARASDESGTRSDVAGLLELVDKEAGRLLRDLCGLREFGEPRAIRPDSLEDACLRDRQIGKPGCLDGREDLTLDGPVRDEEQQAQVEVAAATDCDLTILQRLAVLAVVRELDYS